MNFNPYAQRYRLTFETLDMIFVSDMEARKGEKCWLTIGKYQWETLPWHPIVKEATENTGILDQHAQLKQWAQTHEQPIRNVKLERLVSQPVWEVVQ